MRPLKYLAIGLVAGFLVWVTLLTLPRRPVLYFLAVFLGATAAVFAAALAGLLVSPRWIAVGYAAHGLWDLLHLSHNLGVEVAKWFPPVASPSTWWWRLSFWCISSLAGLPASKILPLNFGGSK